MLKQLILYICQLLFFDTLKTFLLKLLGNSKQTGDQFLYIFGDILPECYLCVMSVPLHQSHYRKSKYTLNDSKQDFLTKCKEKGRNIRGNLQSINCTALHSYYPGKASLLKYLQNHCDPE